MFFSSYKLIIFAFIISFLTLLGFGCANMMSTELESRGTQRKEKIADSLKPSNVQQTSIADTENDSFVIFSLNIQDFAYPDKSALTLNRAIDIHEKYQVPVDVYLTSSIVDYYEKDAPELIQRLKSSSVVAVSYHIRPPAPYQMQAYDVVGFSSLTEDEQYQQIHEYETHGLDLVTGKTTTAPGGYDHLKDSIGYAPYSIGVFAKPDLERVVHRVLKDLGAQLLVVHNSVSNIGDRKNGLYVRPEQYEIKLYEHLGESPQDFVESAFNSAKNVHGATAPWSIGIKMHDNDFFAEKSAWTTVYVKPTARKGPPYDTSLRSPIISEEKTEQIWDLYEQTVAYVADHYTSINTSGVLRLLK